MVPLVSILIPTYNRSGVIKETFDSIINQTYINWECIVVDDHSFDETWNILQEYSLKNNRFKIFKRPLDRLKGGNASRNFAFEQSSGAYINWIDSDDILSEDFIESKLNLFNKNPQLDFVFSDIREFSGNIEQAKSIDRLDFRKKFKNPSLEYIMGNFWIQTGLPLFKRNYLLKYSLHFDENLLMGQEAEFFVRLLLDEPEFKFCSNSILYYRKDQESYMGKFYQLSYPNKYLLTYLPFKKQYLEFQIRNKVDSEVSIFFKNVFNDMLLFLPMSSREFWDLFYFGTKNNLFKGRFQGVKIFIFRIIKLFKLF